jgi:hypothetical protein
MTGVFGFKRKGKAALHGELFVLARRTRDTGDFTNLKRRLLNLFNV